MDEKPGNWRRLLLGMALIPPLLLVGLWAWSTFVPGSVTFTGINDGLVAWPVVAVALGMGIVFRANTGRLLALTVIGALAGVAVVLPPREFLSQPLVLSTSPGGQDKVEIVSHFSGLDEDTYEVSAFHYSTIFTRTQLAHYCAPALADTPSVTWRGSTAFVTLPGLHRPRMALHFVRGEVVRVGGDAAPC